MKREMSIWTYLYSLVVGVCAAYVVATLFSHFTKLCDDVHTIRNYIVWYMPHRQGDK